MLMTMDCPRCGFTQPTDRYCAQCGLDVEAAMKLKPPVWRRILASPRLYLGLIGVLFVLLVVLFLGAKVPRLLGSRSGTYVSSREAAIPGAERAPPDPAVALAAAVTEPDDEVTPAPEPTPPPAQTEAPSLAPEFARFETEFWEISHEQFLSLLDGADRVAEDNAGRAFVVHGADRVRTALKTGGRPVGAAYRETLKPNAQVVIETPPNAAEGLHFGMAVQVLTWENGQANLRLNASLALRPFEGPGEANAGPPPRPIESAIAGPFALTGADALILLIEPTNRRPRAEALSRAGAGPWQILGSPHFRAGETDWIATVRLK